MKIKVRLQSQKQVMEYEIATEVPPSRVGQQITARPGQIGNWALYVITGIILQDDWSYIYEMKMVLTQ